MLIVYHAYITYVPINVVFPNIIGNYNITNYQ